METHDLSCELFAALDHHRESGGHEYEVDDLHAPQGRVKAKSVSH